MKNVGLDVPWTLLPAQRERVIDKVAIVACTDVEGTINYANDLFVEISGYTREELLGANHRILNSYLHPPAFFEEMYRTICAGEIWRGEIRNCAKSGRFYWMDTHIIPSLGSDGRVQGYTSVRFDITLRKQAEEAFRTISQLQSAILDHAGYAVICTRIDGKIEVFNRAAEVMLGYSADELIGRATPALFHDPVEVAARAAQFSQETGKPIQPGFDTFIAKSLLKLPNEHEWTYIRKDGSRLPVLLSVTAVRRTDGDVTGYLGIAVDITERREREAALTRAQAELQRRYLDIENANQRIEMEAAKQVKLLDELAEARDHAQAATDAKSHFLATMSHELRTPMNGVIGVLGLLKSTGLTLEQENLLSIALRSANDLVQLTSDILDLSKLEAKKTDLEMVEFSVKELAEDVAMLLRPSAVEKGLALSCNVAPNLPAVVLGDSHKIRQILVNLISNAIKFTTKGEVTLIVDHQTTSEDRIMLSLRVRDTGIGLDPTSINRLFHQFAQAEQSTARRFGGTGLGLSICKQLAELMGGSIGVESTFGAGSEFWIEIPVERAEAPQAKTIAVPLTAVHSPMNLLVAEDNVTNQVLMRAILDSLGHSTTIVDNGAEAVRMAAAQEFDAILMDVQMPIMDGPTATREIRRQKGRSAKLPIIALTANAMPGDRESYNAAGMDDYISKPVDPGRLIEALSRVRRREAQ